MVRNRWFDRFLAPGFRHVFLIGYVPEFRVWLKYEVLFAYTSVAVISGDYAAGLIGRCMSDGDVLTYRPQLPAKHKVLERIGFWCVPAVRHLLGLRCVAVTPQGLHRFLLRNGAVSLNELQHAEGEA